MRRLILSWFLSSAVMFGLSYLWHAYLLTDINDVTYPLSMFLILAAMVYVMIGGVLYGALSYLVNNSLIDLKTNFPLKSMAVGAVVGFCFYLITFILGLSFNPHGVEHIIADFMWQMCEQSIGGLVISLVFIYDARKAQLEHEGA